MEKFTHEVKSRMTRPDGKEVVEMEKTFVEKTGKKYETTVEKTDSAMQHGGTLSSMSKNRPGVGEIRGRTHVPMTHQEKIDKERDWLRERKTEALENPPEDIVERLERMDKAA